MALWGKDDNLQSSGTVSLNYSTLTVTGSGTTFGTTGFGEVGNVIRFGIKGDGDPDTFFGDAVIKEVTSATSCKIDSTAGLTGEAISGAAYYLSELPKSSIGDHAWSNKHDTNPSYKTHVQSYASDFSPVPTAGSGSRIISVPWQSENLDLNTTGYGRDSLLNGGNNIPLSSVGTGITLTTATSPVGYSTIFIDAPGIFEGSFITLTVGGADGAQEITSVGASGTSVSIAGTISHAVSTGVAITVTSNDMITLASPITVGIATGDKLEFQRLSGGYDRTIYGIGDGTSTDYSGSSDQYRTEGTGWVGVTTYIDQHGNFRVKKETLVAASGITTGSHGLLYPTAQ